MSKAIFAIMSVLTFLMAGLQIVTDYQSTYLAIFSANSISIDMKWQIFIGWNIGVASILASSLALALCAMGRATRETAIAVAALFAIWALIGLIAGFISGSTRISIAPFVFGVLSVMVGFGAINYNTRPDAKIYIDDPDTDPDIDPDADELLDP